MASKGLAALPRTRGSILAHGRGREGRGALPLPRAAAVSTGLRVRVEECVAPLEHDARLPDADARAKVLPRLGTDQGLGLRLEVRNEAFGVRG